MSFSWRRFVPPSEQDQQFLSVLSEINPVAWSEIKSQGGYTLAFGLRSGEIAVRHPQYGFVDSGPDTWIECRHPCAIVVVSPRIDVLAGLDIHFYYGNADVTTLKQKNAAGRRRFSSRCDAKVFACSSAPLPCGFPLIYCGISTVSSGL